MTIETITALIHEHMYDRLNDSNNSNDGKEIEHVQERQHKRKWTVKSNADRTKRPEYQKQKPRDSRCRQCVAHPTGRNNTYAQQKWQNVENAKEDDTTKRCEDRQNEHNTWKE